MIKIDNKLILMIFLTLFNFFIFNIIDQKPLVISDDIKEYYMPLLNNFTDNLSKESDRGHYYFLERPPIFLFFLYIIKFFSNILQYEFSKTFLFFSFLSLLVINYFSFIIFRLFFKESPLDYLFIIIINFNLYNLYLFSHVNSEIIYMLLIFPSIYYFVKSNNKSDFYIIVSALLLSFATLTRPSGIFILFSILLCYFIFFKNFKNTNIKILKFVIFYSIPIMIWQLIIIYFTNSFYFLGTMGSNYLATSLTYIIELENIELSNYSNYTIDLVYSFISNYNNRNLFNTLEFIYNNFSQNYYSFFEILFDKMIRTLNGTHSGAYSKELLVINSIIYLIFIINFIYLILRYKINSGYLKVYSFLVFAIFLTSILQVIAFTPLLRYVIPIINLILILNFVIFNKKNLKNG